MKRKLFVCLLLCTSLLCSCKAEQSQQTRFMLDTVATITADCDDKTIDGAFSVCSDYEKLLSRTVNTSEVCLLNSSEGFVEVSDETVEIIEKALFYSDLSGGRFDITIMPVSSLWDFKNSVIPSKDKIAEALKNVDYTAIEINGNAVNLNGKKIDLGAIAKGYIADKATEYLKQNGVKSGIVNLGGNVVVFGQEYNVGIQKPFSDDIAETLCLKDKSCVTSGIYQRYIEKDGKILHHIIDKTTGFSVENNLASVTVIGNSSADCDALSTVLLLTGLDEGQKILKKTDMQAVFITREGETVLSSGLERKNGLIYLK